MLSYSFPLPSLMLYGSSLICVWQGVRALRRPDANFARFFAALMLVIALYSSGYALELGAKDLDSMLVALRFQYFGVPFVPAFWGLLAYCHLGRQDPPPTWVAIVLSLPLITFLLAQTNCAHHLYYASVTYTRVGSLAISQIAHGPWYYVHFAYINLSFIIGGALFYRAWQIAQPVYRAQAMLMLLGSMAPWAGYLLYFANLAPMGVDLTPFGMIVTTVLYALGAQRYGILHLQPIARSIVFDGIDEGVIVLDTSQRIVDFNRAAVAVFPVLTNDMVGQQLAELAHSAGIEPDVFAVQPSSLFLGRSGEKRDYQVKRYPLSNKAGEQVGCAILLQDVTDKARLERELLRQAHTDQLCGIYNRRHLCELSENAMQLALRHKRELSVIIIDVDFFKEVNDSQGHLAGDALLSRIALLMQMRVRATDILGRFGGDEFVITLPETPAHAAVVIAEHISLAVRMELGHGLSIGVAGLSSEMRSFGEILQCADEALYKVKASGRGRVMQYAPPGIHRSSSKRGH